ncbi:sigma-70 family RNA polymerase sigma factor [Kitasatospora sp. NPDC057015]|uniref:sigma-70 family RNA polymerase sigma factor n=1 Tax=Kitasatospora sp. NPDC057015 TaxID=3346001 RepID=UPI003626AC4E
MSDTGPDRDAASAASLGHLPASESEIDASSRDGEFAYFYRTCIRRLVAFLMWQGASAALAADLAQDTMLQAYERWDRIQLPEAWSRRVASRKLVRAFSQVEESTDELALEPTSLLPSPGEAAEWEQRQEILRLLQDLPSRQRQVMAWTLDGYSPAEIAAELGLKSAAVRASLFKARMAVSSRMTDREGE